MTQPIFQTEDAALLTRAAPVLKWAGGKGQLLPQLRERYPKGLEHRTLTTYIEPFFGGGAVFFDLVKTCPGLEHIYLCDVNPELVLLYRVIQRDIDTLIEALRGFEETYLSLDEEARKAFFYELRSSFNDVRGSIDFGRYSSEWVLRAAKTLFLNKTCFNGLFRVNRKGHFNVPHGRYKNPTILHEPRLRAAHEALRYAEIRLGDFAQIAELADEKTFVYYDPPYRPISETATFTSYAGAFGDDEQRRLAALYRALDTKGATQLLSNSDPTNYVDDPFFDDLYAGFCIERIDANRMINAKASKRGAVREILVRNYEV
ncbi:MAG: DNA adenine methylase [Trueperaceae bacterium]|nr:DNA adenine methylase [Trueperaceae bacterium]